MPLSDVLLVEWSTASDPFATSPTFVDITSKVRAVKTGGGKTSSLELYGVRHATIEVDNTSATISPTTWYRWRQVRISRPTYAATILTDSPVGYWRLNETSGTTATDTAGASNGTYTATFTLGAAGLVTNDSATALSLAGTGYVSIPDVAGLRPGLGNFTTEAIIKRNGLPGGSEFIYAKGDATLTGYELFVTTAGKAEARIGAVTLLGTSNVCDNVAHHIAVTFTRAGNGVIYVDGVAETTLSIASESARNLNGTAALEIGRRSTGNNFTGTIDEVAYYASALSSTRVLAHAAAKAGSPSAAGDVIFRGFVEEITHDQGNAPFQAIATIECADILAVIARYEYSTSGVPEELSGARIDRVVDTLGVPNAWQSFAAGNVYISQPTDDLLGVATAGQINANALTHLQDVTESEVGALYVSNAGVVTFEDRYQIRTRLLAAAQVTFSDTASGTEVPYLYGNLQLTPPGTDYRNSVTFTGTSQTAQTTSNIPTNYPTDALSRTLPISRDTQAKANSELLLEVYRQTAVTWPMTIKLHVHPSAQNTLDKIAALDLRRYCIVKATPVGSAQQTYKVIVEQIEHDITPDSWITTLGFSSGDRWVNGWITAKTFLLLDDGTAGQLDQEQLAF